MDLKNDKSKDMTTSGSNYIYQTVFCQHNNLINLPFIEIRHNCQYNNLYVILYKNKNVCTNILTVFLIHISDNCFLFVVI